VSVACQLVAQINEFFRRARSRLADRIRDELAARVLPVVSKADRKAAAWGPGGPHANAAHDLLLGVGDLADAIAATIWRGQVDRPTTSDRAVVQVVQQQHLRGTCLRSHATPN
jgi:hypothetical protein